MRFDKFTVKAQEALANAQSLAAQKQHGEVTALHVLSALLADRDGIIRPLLAKLGVDAGHLESAIETQLDRLPSVSGGAQLGMARDVSEVLAAAQKEADRLKDEYLSTEHLLLGLIASQSAAKNALTSSGINKNAL